MEKLIIISPGKITSNSLAVQCREVFGKYINVESYCFEDDLSFDVAESLVVLSSPRIINERIQALIEKGLNYIIARRVVDYKYISDLMNLPKAMEVLLVNDREETTYQSIAQLKALGVNNIKYYPYYPGIDSYPKLDIVVTVGEPDLIPYEVKQIIDIKTRRLDITTLIEIAQKLNLIEILGDNLSSHYLNEIIRLLNHINDDAKEMKMIGNRLETVANCLPKAILYVKNGGKIIVSNQVMYDILGLSDKDVIGKDIKDILPELALNDEKNKVEIIVIGSNTLFVTSNIIEGRDSEDGIIYTFENSEEIEKNEHKIRRFTTRNAIKTKYYNFDDIIYKSKNMKELIEKAKTFAKTDSTILIQGESGTGKELFAQAIHSSSERKLGPFVPVNFAAITTSLIESELFGYEGGSFTGAIKSGKRGLFEEAHEGTIFLDEIGDASLEFQCTLLRVIQERQIRRVGGIKEIPINVRIIAATNKNLIEEINKGNFRTDLYYRLNVLPIKMLTLRERKSDILVLSNHFLKKYSNNKITDIEQYIEDDAIKVLCDYDWPGNIRQLENAMEYLVTIGKDMKDKLKISHLPEYIIESQDNFKTNLYEQILGKDMIWVLHKIMNLDGVGRRYLAEVAIEEKISLTEGQIRNLINNASNLGLVTSNVGKKGTVLTKKGRDLLSLMI